MTMTMKCATTSIHRKESVCLGWSFPSHIFIFLISILLLSFPRYSNSFVQVHPTTKNAVSSPTRSYAVAVSPRQSSSSSSSTSAFEDRMRDIALKREGRQVKEDTRLPPNVITVRTLEEYKRLFEGEGRERIVCVRFFATWCRACKAIQPLFYRMALKFSDVLFVEVPVTDSNSLLHQGLGVPSLPFGHIYVPGGGLVEEHRITRPHFAQFAHKLQSYILGSCELLDGETRSPYRKVQNKLKKGATTSTP